MRWTRLTLIVLEALVALSAFAAGAMFVEEPSGRLIGMTEATLARSPAWELPRAWRAWCWPGDRRASGDDRARPSAKRDLVEQGLSGAPEARAGSTVTLIGSFMRQGLFVQSVAVRS